MLDAASTLIAQLVASAIVVSFLKFAIDKELLPPRPLSSGEGVHMLGFHWLAASQPVCCVVSTTCRYDIDRGTDGDKRRVAIAHRLTKGKEEVDDAA